MYMYIWVYTYTLHICIYLYVYIYKHRNQDSDKCVISQGSGSAVFGCLGFGGPGLRFRVQGFRVYACFKSRFRIQGLLSAYAHRFLLQGFCRMGGSVN